MEAFGEERFGGFGMELGEAGAPEPGVAGGGDAGADDVGGDVVDAELYLFVAVPVGGEEGRGEAEDEEEQAHPIMIFRAGVGAVR
jgi:hypothetical protein